MAVYVVLAVLAAVENIVPPVPADMAVALGAFLTHRGVTTLPMVFAVTLASNMLGAAGVYYAARRYGRRLFATPTGRRLLAPDSIKAMEREYLRFGLAGIFLARLLPGIRAVVAPFAGIANLSAPRALIPMAFASALWYGGVSLLGSAIGAEWGRISAVLSGINRTLGALTIVAVVAIGVVLLLRRRRRARTRVWGAIRRAFGETGSGEAPVEREVESEMRSAALLLLELAYAESQLTPAERAEVVSHLRGRWGLDHSGEAPAPERHPERTELASYRRRIIERFAHPRRLALVERLWHVAFSAGAGQRSRDLLVRRAAELLGFSAEEVAEAEARVRGSGP